jgi:peptidoglycan/xylan/chitin deacetylase (PgdA/CDA1 family)
MKYYWIKTNALIKKIFPRYTWDIPNTENKIYLSFDDGPIPEITEWVLEELKKYNAKATFFCIGDNIEKHPELFKKVINEGHAIGNHTFNHLNGWKTTTENYIQNVRLAETAISKFKTQDRKLFRPPYGKIKSSQSKRLIQLGYKIIMWDVLSADFDTTITQEQCLKNAISSVKSGSIIVFHDSQKAARNLKYSLPKTLELLSKKGFVFEPIP